MNFVVTPPRARKLARIIAEYPDGVAVRRWSTIMYDYLEDPVQLIEVAALLNEHRYEEAIGLTLVYWQSCTGYGATFAQCVWIFRNRFLITLASHLEENAVFIQHRHLHDPWRRRGQILETILAIIISVPKILILVALLPSPSLIRESEERAVHLLEIGGDPGHYVKWTEVVKHKTFKPEEIRYMNITYVDLGDPNRFVFMLQPFSELRTLYMSHIVWNSAHQFTEQVHLPHLEKFIFSHDMDMALEMDRYFAQGPRHIKCTHEAPIFLNSLLFVYKNPLEKGAELYDSLNMNISISVGSEELHFAYNNVDKSLSLKGLHLSVLTQISSMHGVQSIQIAECVYVFLSGTSTESSSSWFQSIRVYTQWTLSEISTYFNRMNSANIILVIHLIVALLLPNKIKRWIKLYPAVVGTFEQVSPIESLLPIVLESISKVY